MLPSGPGSAPMTAAHFIPRNAPAIRAAHRPIGVAAVGIRPSTTAGDDDRPLDGRRPPPPPPPAPPPPHDRYAQISASVGTFLFAITFPMRDTFIRCL